MILWSASLLPKKNHFNNALVFPPPLKRVKRKGNYQVCENNTLVCLPPRLCTRRQQVEASVAGEAAARLVLSNTPLKWTPTAGSDHIACCNIICGTIGSLTHLSSGCWFSSRLLVQPLLWSKPQNTLHLKCDTLKWSKVVHICLHCSQVAHIRLHDDNNDPRWTLAIILGEDSFTLRMNWY